MTDDSGKPPAHIQRWAPADWLTSPLRMALIVERDLVTRLAYRELLDVLYFHGGKLARKEAPGALGLTVKQTDHAIARLLESGRVQEIDGMLCNGRVSRDLQRAAAFNEVQKARANKRWHPDGMPGDTAGMPIRSRNHSRSRKAKPLPETTDDAVASALTRHPARGRQLKLTEVQRRPLSEEAELLVKAWTYLTDGRDLPATPGLVDALARLDGARYTKAQRALIVVAATTERYYREMKGLSGIRTALGLGGLPRVKDGVVISQTKNHAEGLLNEPRRYSEKASRVLARLGALDEATARGWRPV